MCDSFNNSVCIHNWYLAEVYVTVQVIIIAIQFSFTILNSWIQSSLSYSDIIRHLWSIGNFSWTKYQLITSFLLNGKDFYINCWIFMDWYKSAFRSKLPWIPFEQNFEIILGPKDVSGFSSHTYTYMNSSQALGTSQGCYMLFYKYFICNFQ